MVAMVTDLMRVCLLLPRQTAQLVSRSLQSSKDSLTVLILLSHHKVSSSLFSQSTQVWSVLYAPILWSLWPQHFSSQWAHTLTCHLYQSHTSARKISRPQSLTISKKRKGSRLFYCNACFSWFSSATYHSFFSLENLLWSQSFINVVSKRNKLR